MRHHVPPCAPNVQVARLLAARADQAQPLGQHVQGLDKECARPAGRVRHGDAQQGRLLLGGGDGILQAVLDHGDQRGLDQLGHQLGRRVVAARQLAVGDLGKREDTVGGD